MANKGKKAKVKDLPLDRKITEKDLKSVGGGAAAKKRGAL
jgi:hypothetical protein